MRCLSGVLMFAGMTLLTAALAARLDSLALAQPASVGSGAAPAGPGGSLGHLTTIRPGRSARVSSAAPKRSSNCGQPPHPAGQDARPGRHPGPGHDPAHLAHVPRAGPELAGPRGQSRPLRAGAAHVLGRGQGARRRVARRRFLRRRVRPAGGGELGPGRGRRGRRLQLLLAHALLQVGADRAGEPERTSRSIPSTIRSTTSRRSRCRPTRRTSVPSTARNSPCNRAATT